MNRRKKTDKAEFLPWIREHKERFQAFMKGEKMSENTILRYLDIVEKFLLLFGKPPEKLTKWDMQRYKQEISPRYCENSMSTMIAAINQYTEKILERPDLKMKPPKRVFKPKIPLTVSEIKQILNEAKNPTLNMNGNINNSNTNLRDHALICLLYFGELRASEAANARISDIDFGNKTIRVNEGKGKDFKPVNLTDYALNAIREYIEKGRPKPSKAANGDFVFLSIRGNRMTRKNIWEIVKGIKFRAGITKNVHPHIFRHSAITHQAEKGLSALYIQVQSRHKSLDMVQKYTHLSQKSVRDAYDRTMTLEPDIESSENEIIRETNQSMNNNPDIDNRKLKLFDLLIEGEISDEKYEKLLSILEGKVTKSDPRIELL